MWNVMAGKVQRSDRTDPRHMTNRGSQDGTRRRENGAMHTRLIRFLYQELPDEERLSKKKLSGDFPQPHSTGPGGQRERTGLCPCPCGTAGRTGGQVANGKPHHVDITPRSEFYPNGIEPVIKGIKTDLQLRRPILFPEKNPGINLEASDHLISQSKCADQSRDFLG
jgi:hypothetical protein